MKTLFLTLFCLFFVISSNCLAQYDQLQQIGIDHINIAVENLEDAEVRFRLLGFTIKPGKTHENTINNLHIKFKNGTEIELITAKEPKDDLSREYLEMISRGEGGAFLALGLNSFHNKVFERFEQEYSIIEGQSIGSKSYTFEKKDNLRPIWFIQTRTDFIEENKYLMHDNSALELNAVWLSNSIEKEISDLLSYLGKKGSTTTTHNQIQLDNGEIIFADIPMNEIGRPIVGVTVKVRDLNKINDILETENIPYIRIEDRLRIPSKFTGNIFIDFK